MIVFIPSYGRPKSVYRMMMRLAEMETTADIVWVVDINDWTLFDYVDEFEKLNCNYVAVEGGSLTAALNRVSSIAAHQYPEEEVFGWIGDDTKVNTPFWDQKLRDALPPTGISYGNDGIQGQALPTHFFITSNIVKTLGYFFPPEFHHLYTDNWIKRVGDDLGIIQYVPEVDMEHLHPLVGKAEEDETYKNNNSRNDSDLRAFLSHDYEATYTKLRKLL